ncbi:hypothetical protein V5O48_007901 [Marasmius crinis-equi]|uniref:Alpha-L-arabinofuranosidase n=1 Tax=Marasmius crinis-equi TaxID=585013 RepID=A0ABR3FFT9_9AGAR
MSTQKLWYFIYQDGNAAYSINSDITNPTGWSAPKYLTGTPSTITQNIIGSTEKRYFRSWSASSLSASWTALHATEPDPFAGTKNVQFSGSAMTLPDCGPQENLFQGLPNGSSGTYYNALPWKFVLLTSKTCPSGSSTPPTTITATSQPPPTSGGGSEW